jgi:hypothetical protein
MPKRRRGRSKDLRNKTRVDIGLVVCAGVEAAPAEKVEKIRKVRKVGRRDDGT